MNEELKILKDTYGVMVYQEQVIHGIQKLGKLSLAKADIVRKAMGKKDENEFFHRFLQVSS